MKLDILDKTGKAKEKLELSDSVFGAEPNADLLAQYIRVYLHNQRQGTSAAKTRAEVSGGGRKPWRQKGTGRARHGSIRSPLWRTGGVAHGPKPKSWNLKFPKKMTKAAVISALSAKNHDKQIVILDKISQKEPKTKDIVKLMDDLNVTGRTLLVLDKKDDAVLKSARNIADLNVALWENLNAYQIMDAEIIIFIKDAVVSLDNKYKKA